MQQVEAVPTASTPFGGLSYLAIDTVTIPSIPCVTQSVNTTGSIRTVGIDFVSASGPYINVVGYGQPSSLVRSVSAQFNCNRTARPSRRYIQTVRGI